MSCGAIWGSFCALTSNPLVVGILCALFGFFLNPLWEFFKRIIDPDRFRLLFAKYGVPALQNDVTKILKNKIKEDRLESVVNANLFNGLDPAPGKVKRLTVEYLNGNRLYTVEVDENQNIDIP